MKVSKVESWMTVIVLTRNLLQKSFTGCIKVKDIVYNTIKS